MEFDDFFETLFPLLTLSLSKVFFIHYMEWKQFALPQEDLVHLSIDFAHFLYKNH